jgi:TolA-binding protein
MDELQALARAVEAERPPIPAELLRAQRQRLRADPRARVRAARRRSALGAIGALALSLAAAWLLWSPSDAPPPERADSSARGRGIPEHAPSERRLQDGTQILLDTGASGQLAQNAPEDVRFELDRGRAEFDVTPNRARRFRVLAGDYEVRVLGTRFSVEYDPAGGFAVWVTRGLVSVASPSRVPALLEAGDRLLAADGRWRIERAGNAPATSADAGPAPASEPAPAVSIRDDSPRRPEPRAAPAAPPQPRESSSDWRRLYRAGDYARALRVAREAGLDRLAARLEPAALADLADSARLGGDPSAALQLLAVLESRFGDSEWASRASFLSGRLLQREGRHAEAIAQFERHLERDPDGAHAAETRGRLMQGYVAMGERGRARAQAEAYLSRYPDGPYRRLASALMAAP